MKLAGSRLGLVLAAVILVVLEKFVPFGELALYPFTLLATWVHEMGHGLAALFLGGAFDHLEIFGDASGVAFTTSIPGWHSALVAAAGLLGPPVAGAGILAFARGPRRGALVLGGIAIAVLVSVVFWVRSAVGVFTLVPLALLLGLLALRAGRARLVLAQLLGLLFAMDTLARFDYLFSSTAMIGGAQRASDVVGIAAGLFPPALLWGVLIAALDLVLLYGGLRAAWAPARAPKVGAVEAAADTTIRRAQRARQRT